MQPATVIAAAREWSIAAALSRAVEPTVGKSARRARERASVRGQNVANFRECLEEEIPVKLFK